MGNCCDTRGHNTDNEAENLIRESIGLLKIRKFEYSEFYTIVSEAINISMLDIEPSTLSKWITKEIYEKIVNERLINGTSNSIIDNVDFIENQKLSCLNYEELFKKSDSGGVYNNFFFFIIAYTKLNSQSKYEKIKAIEKFIQKTNRVLNFSTLTEFLKKYLDVLLYEITNHFHYSGDIAENKYLNTNYSALIKRMFNKDNVAEFSTNVIKSCGNIVGGQMYTTGVNISNNFVNKNQMRKFFSDNSYLLDIFELRENFFITFRDRDVITFTDEA